ncbi:MAG TPA: calcium-binding protein [Acidimicrobiales bacterium]|nr:calcium-binding protein [Acidimicrobiales bacterium]
MSPHLLKAWTATPRMRAGAIALVSALSLALVYVGRAPSYAVQFCNTTPIFGTAGTGPSSPYPSTINVSGLVGTITDVNVTLRGVTTNGDNNAPAEHWVEDVDAMVAAPAATSNVILMSDAGGNNDVSSGPLTNVDLTFDGEASNLLPADSALSTGTWRPVDDDDDVAPQPGFEADAWAAPAPAPTNSANLSSFNTLNPNGAWTLWVVDDQNQASTDINGGWCVDILTSGGTTTTTTAAPNNAKCASPPPATIFAKPGVTTTGTSGNDVIYGTAGNDVIYGGGGNDVILGRGGSDRLYGGNDQDVLCGGAESDQLYGQAGHDKLAGDSGNDSLYGGIGNDGLVGGLAADRLFGDSGVDTCAPGGQTGDYASPPPSCDTIT